MISNSLSIWKKKNENTIEFKQDEVEDIKFEECEIIEDDTTITYVDKDLFIEEFSKECESLFEKNNDNNLNFKLVINKVEKALLNILEKFTIVKK